VGLTRPLLFAGTRQLVVRIRSPQPTFSNSEARKFALHFALANQYCDQLSNAVRSAVIGNAGTLVVFRVGSRDAELLAPEFRPMEPGGLSDQEPFTAWLRWGIGQDRIFVEGKLYPSRGTAEAIREHSRQRFGRSRGAIERQRQVPL